MVAFFCPPPFMRVASLTSEFVGITSLYVTTRAIGWPSGTQAGDLAVIFGSGTSSLSASGWTSIAGDAFQGAGTTSFLFRVITASDISAPPSITMPAEGGWYVIVYRGGSSVAKRSAAVSGATTVAVAGFTKNSNAKRIIGCATDRDGGTQSTPPSGFTFRTTGASQYFMHAVYDLPAASYVNGSSVTFNLVAGSFGGSGALLEIS